MKDNKMEIFADPFIAVGKVKFKNSRSEIRKLFNNDFESTIDSYGTDSDFYLNTLFEVAYINDKPDLIMVNYFIDNKIWFGKILLSVLTHENIFKYFKDIDGSIYYDSDTVLLWETGIGFYFEDLSEAARQICFFRKETQFFNKILPALKKYHPGAGL